jgi:5,10-methylenetetrahydromethanopterin reductase
MITREWSGVELATTGARPGADRTRQGGGDTSALAFYVVPGHVTSAAPVAREVGDGARLGFGAVLVSERLNVKHSAVLGGYAAALAGDMEVVTALTFPHTRHPMDLAAYGATLGQLATGGFTLGLGRGPNYQWDAWGMPRSRIAMPEERASLLRTLWRGGTVSDHDGPLGRFPGRLSLGVELERPPRLALGALGPRTQELAGRAFDDLILHSHWTDDAVTHSVALARRAAERAGRDPDALRVWAMLVTACDLPEEQILQRVVRRLTTYLQWPRYGELIVAANGWDPAVLRRVREHLVLADRMADTASFSTEELLRLAEVYPEHWLRDGAAIGDRRTARTAPRERWTPARTG